METLPIQTLLIRALWVLGVPPRLMLGFARIGAALAWFLVFAALPAKSTPLLLRTLENQFPVWSDKGGAPPTGIIVVGGGLATYLAAERLGDRPPGPGQRVVAGIALAKRFPNAKLLFAGGGEPNPIAALARAGINPARILIESRSRNTAENATFASQLVRPKSDERWILVTSAYHMPRAMGSFRAAGFAVEAYPVDFLSDLPNGDQTGSARALREFMALLGYRLSGRMSDSNPDP